jgi:hypothetical protein
MASYKRRSSDLVGAAVRPASMVTGASRECEDIDGEDIECEDIKCEDMATTPRVESENAIPERFPLFLGLSDVRGSARPEEAHRVHVPSSWDSYCCLPERYLDRSLRRGAADRLNCMPQKPIGHFR